MKNWWNYFVTGMLCMSCLACTKQTIVDTGIPSPYYEGSILDYLRGDNYNFKMTVDMIERSGLVDLFEGNDPSCPEITFLAFKTHSVYLYLLQHDLDSVAQLTPEFCKNVILRHVIPGKHVKSEIGYRDPDVDFTAGEIPVENIGGTLFVTSDDADVLLYREKTDYKGIPDMGPEVMYAYSLTEKKYLPVATPDIQPQNGVIHALTEYYRWEYDMLEWENK